MPGFRKADVIKAYIAFLGNLVDVDNQKIIEEKMDELIADSVLDTDITFAMTFGKISSRMAAATATANSASSLDAV